MKSVNFGIHIPRKLRALHRQKYTEPEKSHILCKTEPEVEVYL